MNSFDIRFESPWMLLLLIPAFAVVLVPWLFIPRVRRSSFRKKATMVLHLVLALALVLVLSGVSLTAPVEPEDPAEQEEAEKGGEGGILILADGGKVAEGILDLLPEDVPVTVCRPYDAPSDIASLGKYDRIMLLGVSANGLPDPLAGSLILYVQQGGSLLLSASDHSFSLGNMKGTAYETLMPVSFDYMSKEGESVALMLVLDCSNSMTGSGGGWWWSGSSDNLSMAKQGAIRSIEALTSDDTVGVVTFNSTATLQSGLVPATDTEKAVLARQISALGTSRGTYYCDALELAWEELERSDAPVRHVIFLSDGEPSDYGYDDIVSDMAEDGITLSTIALGYSSSILKSMASSGGGRYYAVTSVEELPDIMLGETEAVASDPLVKEETAVTLPGGIPTDLPPVSAYVGTTLKENAELILQTETGDPILARWSLGDGEADAFASDLLNDWTGEWRDTNPGRNMLRQIFSMGLSAAEEEDDGVRLTTETSQRRTITELLLPLSLILLVGMLVDVTVRRLRWKDIQMFFGL